MFIPIWVLVFMLLLLAAPWVAYFELRKAVQWAELAVNLVEVFRLRAEAVTAEIGSVDYLSARERLIIENELTEAVRLVEEAQNMKLPDGMRKFMKGNYRRYLSDTFDGGNE